MGEDVDVDVDPILMITKYYEFSIKLNVKFNYPSNFFTRLY